MNENRVVGKSFSVEWILLQPLPLSISFQKHNWEFHSKQYDTILEALNALLVSSPDTAQLCKK